MNKLFYLVLVVILIPFTVKGQDTDENYIKTTTYQIATTASNVADDYKIEGVTYYDGLGRPVQSISARAGGDRENIVTHMEYDEFGMQPKEYLPWASNGKVPVSTSLKPSKYETSDATVLQQMVVIHPQTQYVPKQ